MRNIGTENGAKGGSRFASLSSSWSSGVPGSRSSVEDLLRQVMAAFLGLRMLSDRRRVAMAIPSVQAEREDIARVTVVTKTGRSVQRRLGKEYGPHGYRS